MRIAVDVRSLMDGRHSGVEEYTIELIKAIQRVAPERDLVLFYNSWKNVDLPKFEKVEVKRWRYPNKILNIFQLILKWPKWDSMVEADVFFVPNSRLLPLSTEGVLVVTAHDLSFEKFPEFYSWQRRLWHKMMRPKDLLRRANAIVAVSKATADDVANLYNINSSKITVIYSGVREAKLKEIENMKNERAIISNKYILFLGTLEPRKNVYSIVKAYDAIAGEIEHDLVIAGSSGWLSKEAESAIDSSHHRNRIHLLGFVTETHKFNLYKNADIFVYPSFYEGFGFPPLEALLAGTPVVTSNNSSLPEIVGEWAVMVNPYDVAELSLVLKNMLGDLPIISEQERNIMREKYSWDRAARMHLTVFDEVFKSKKNFVSRG